MATKVRNLTSLNVQAVEELGRADVTTASTYVVFDGTPDEAQEIINEGQAEFGSEFGTRDWRYRSLAAVRRKLADRVQAGADTRHVVYVSNDNL